MCPRPCALGLVLAACVFRPEGVSLPPDGSTAPPDGETAPPDASVPPVDATVIATLDALAPDAAPVCGNGLVEPGEGCEPGDVLACATSCGDEGTQTCTSTCALGPCRVELAAAGLWGVASTASGIPSPVDLPHTNWGCTGCTRHYTASVCDRPRAVSFRWASDNRARLFVNGSTAFDDFWLPAYCTDAPCCTKCCDTPSNCQAGLSMRYSLDAAALALFTSGDNHLRWEVNQEAGGSGFYVVMTVEY